MGPVSWEWESLQELHGGDALRASNEEQSRLPGGVGAHFSFRLRDAAQWMAESCVSHRSLRG